jgi:Filamin/ABP280 repeat.
MALTSEKGTDVPLSVTDNEDGTFTVDYCAPAPGNYTLNVLYGGVTVSRCPLRVPVQPHVDVSKIKVDGLEPSKLHVNYNNTQVYRVMQLMQNI